MPVYQAAHGFSQQPQAHGFSQQPAAHGFSQQPWGAAPPPLPPMPRAPHFGDFTSDSGLPWLSQTVLQPAQHQQPPLPPPPPPPPPPPGFGSGRAPLEEKVEEKVKEGRVQWVTPMPPAHLPPRPPAAIPPSLF